MHKLAVIADPHYHEIFPGYRFKGVAFDARQGACIRTFTDSAASTRIYNESYFAFPAALDACVAEGIRTIVIAGDLTDDGQIATMESALALLARYRDEHDMRFFLTPGNHDVYGMSGRHHAKAFYDAEGGSTVVTSDPAHALGSPVIVDEAMFCRSYAETAPLWAPYGIQRHRDDIHWESPFGSDDAFSARMFEMTSPDGSVTHRQLDLSYLVEPVPGLWLVAIDANVFEPRNGRPDNTQADAFDDSTDAGWNALVRLKPFILDWLSDISARAADHGKTLLCFSHYPAIDTYDGTVDIESNILGKTQAVRRTPRNDTSRIVARTGIGTHFSGHLHVSDTATVKAGGHSLTNIAIPSPVAFPPAFAIVSADDREMDVGYRQLDFPRYDAFFPFYRRDTGARHWTNARDYGEFLYRHVRELVRHRYLPEEWPADFAKVMLRLSVDDLFAIARIDVPLSLEDYAPAKASGEGLTAIDLVTDWYAARKASSLVSRYISPDRMVKYERLIDAYARRSWPTSDCLQARLKRFLEMMARYLEIENSEFEAAQ